jgi:exopolyphosphatase/guanosine-5'-triphosphate,3'-diphosphate pyrophosphatase
MAFEKKRLAAIDIGSNAIRMMISELSPHGLTPLRKYRIPIRLGADVFEKGKISGKNLKAAARAFRKFKEVAQKSKVSRIRAVGTSALRESKNGKAFVELIHRKSGIRIEVIDGVEEARLIHMAVAKELHLEGHRSLLIDIGGGSVELTFSDHGLMSATQSFPFGTVRTLEMMKKKNLQESQLNLVIGEFITPLSHFIHSQAPNFQLEFAVGTGGNLEALGKLKAVLLKKSSKGGISYSELSEMIEKLRGMSIKDRIEKLELRPDRADVIIPAAMVVQAVLRQAGLQKILIPYVGLKDGLMWSMLRPASD